MQAPLDGLFRDPASGGRPRQLLVLCHGARADARQLLRLAGVWAEALPDAAFAAPNAPYSHRPRWLPSGLSFGREWFNLADKAPIAVEAGVRKAADLLNVFIDSQLERLALPGDACALIGFSQGAMTAVFAGLRRPVAPGGIVTLAGALLGAASLGKEILNRAPVLMIHGEGDKIVPPTSTRIAAEVLSGLGVPVETAYLPGVGHTIEANGIARTSAMLCRVFSASAVGYLR